MHLQISPKMDLSIIIVTYNTRAVTLDCLSSLAAHPPSVPYEVIVVDNASADGTEKAIRELFPAVTFIRNTRNLGFAAANNRGIVHSKGDYVLLLNSDTVVGDNALSLMVDHMDRNPDVGLLGCKLVYRDGMPQMAYAANPNLLMLLIQTLGLKSLFPRRAINRFIGRSGWRLMPSKTLRGYFGESRCSHPGHIGEAYNIGPGYYLTGACLMMRRSCIEEIGLLDENFFMYGEDADLCLRAHQEGWNVAFLPTATVVHLVGASAGPDYRELSYEAQRGVLYFFYKHRSRTVFKLAKALRIAGIVRKLAANVICGGPRVETGRTWGLVNSLLKLRDFPPPRELTLVCQDISSEG